MADLKITELGENTTPASTDIVAMVDDPGGSPATEKMTLATLDTHLSATEKTLTNKTLTTPVINGLVTGTFGGYNNSLNRQAIINGNFDVWQRGTSFTDPINTEYLADRWVLGLASSAWSATASRQAFTLGQTDVPNNPKYFFRLDISTATTTFLALNHKIEGVNNFAGNNCTLSFYAKVDSGEEDVATQIRQNFGSGGSPSSNVDTAGDTATLTTSWQKFTTTFSLPSISGKTLGSTAGTDYLELRFTPPNSTTKTFDIAQVQLCAGEVALPFMPKSFAQELADCQRYYEKSYDYAVTPTTASASGASYTNASGTTLRYFQQFKVNKRTTPTVVVYATATGNSAKMTDVDNSNVDVTATLHDEAQFGFTTGATVTDEHRLRWQWTADAEL